MAIPAYYSLIQKGSYGPDEALVQTWLNGVRDQCSYYPALTTDGRFGTKSENAVKEFQLRNNMNMDGKVGANTWNVLYAKYTAKHGLAVPYPGIVMRTGMSGGTIRLIQQKLNTLGEKIGTDGKFGSRTAAAVQRFQRRNGLNANGAVGNADRRESPAFLFGALCFGVTRGEQPLVRASRASKVAGAFLVLFWHAKENIPWYNRAILLERGLSPCDFFISLTCTWANGSASSPCWMTSAIF